MGEDAARPLIGIPCCFRRLGIYDCHVVGEKYARAIARATGGLPVMIPAMADELALDEILERLDGLFLTGSPSNVEPRHYAGAPLGEGVMIDPRRDALTLPLIREAVARGLPLFGICRGHQEINVALGGSLHARVHEVAGMLDHRADTNLARARRYAPAHALRLAKGGLLEGLAGAESVEVNSLHGQGIARPAPGLAIEARAPDGLIEAVRATDAPGFALAVQWHPEWEVMGDAFSVKLFAAFDQAVRAHARDRAAAARRPRARPLVGVTSDRAAIGVHPFAVVCEIFLAAVHDAADCLPVGIPSLPGEIDAAALLERLDGLFLSGSNSMVHPELYGARPIEPDMALDGQRDAAVLPMIREALAQGVPTLGICRGFHEINVAHGGTLHQEIARTPRLIDHDRNSDRPMEELFEPAHELSLEPGGLLARLTGRETITVNSAHRQGIDELGRGLAVEARAPDGLIEAARVIDAPGFALAVQWHPEYEWREKPDGRAIFGAFREAVAARARERAVGRAA